MKRFALLALLTLNPPCCLAAGEVREKADELERLSRGGALQMNLGADKEIPFELDFVKFSDNSWQLAILQLVKVNAPLERLVAVLDDVKSYVGIFKDLKIAEARDWKSRDDFVLYTETSIPFPFVPNDKSSMHYLLSRSEERIRYRFSLKEGNHMKAFEGVAAAEKLDPTHSRYWEIDLVEPEFGMSRMIPSRKFWKESGLSSLQSAWALKLRAESAQAEAGKILEESNNFADSQEPAVEAALERVYSWDAFREKIIPKIPSKAAKGKKPSAPARSTAKPKQSGPKSEPKP